MFREIFSVGRTLGRTPNYALCLEGEMATCAIMYQFMVCGRGRNMVGKVVTKKCRERGMWINLPEWPKNVKIFLSHVNVHQRVTSAEEDFNNQVDKITCSLDTPWLLSHPTLVIAPWAHKQSVCGGWDGGYPHIQQRGLLLNKADLATAIMEHLLSQPLSLSLALNKELFLGGLHQPPGDGLITLDLRHHERDSVLSFLQ